ncbi:uncharacterized protein EV420DRAFT_1519851 [Desarmillaria tabescens]|uniref:Uncharacterized protein n=1 Tax=Armillaria tabescens TaxID=1929756 RepID=A0AA39TUB5_ARMTA|nr:uncharacterized protein EV420DRAFT_1519851 [Desarmillaria tabescens]KAK0463739.1 hypothetical protein EV420DRAFT_1519851 [Desarmillaria tabescens]
MLKSSITTSSISLRATTRTSKSWALWRPALSVEYVRSIHASPARCGSGSSRSASKRYKERINRMHVESLDTFFRRLYEKFPSSSKRVEVARMVKEAISRISTNRVAIRSMATLDRLYNVEETILKCIQQKKLPPWLTGRERAFDNCYRLPPERLPPGWSSDWPDWPLRHHLFPNSAGLYSKSRFDLMIRYTHGLSVYRPLMYCVEGNHRDDFLFECRDGVYYFVTRATSPAVQVAPMVDGTTKPTLGSFFAALKTRKPTQLMGRKWLPAETGRSFVEEVWDQKCMRAYAELIYESQNASPYVEDVYDDFPENT